MSPPAGVFDCLCFTSRGTPSSWWWRPQEAPPTPSSCSLSRACSSSPRQQGAGAASCRPASTRVWWRTGSGPARGPTSAAAPRTRPPSGAFLGGLLMMSSKGWSLSPLTLHVTRDRGSAHTSVAKRLTRSVCGGLVQRLPRRPLHPRSKLRLTVPFPCFHQKNHVGSGRSLGLRDRLHDLLQHHARNDLRPSRGRGGA